MLFGEKKQWTLVYKSNEHIIFRKPYNPQKKFRYSVLALNDSWFGPRSQLSTVYDPLGHKVIGTAVFDLHLAEIYTK